MLKVNLKKAIPMSIRSAFVAISLVALAACDSTELLGTDSGSVIINVDDSVLQDDGTDNSIATDDSVATANIVDTAVSAGSFTTLVAALEASGLDAVLADESSTFTVFAPTDDAFAALGSGAIEALLADTDALTNVLLGHVISGNSVSAETAFSLAGGTVDAANGSALAISNVDGALFINESQVTTADIAASNGVIHVIDSVILPEQAAVVQDDGGAGGTTPALANIVDTAFAAGNFNRLGEALKATGLDTVLMDEKINFTVFAPTDAAFDALGDDTINALLADPSTLSDILRYHLLADAVVTAQSAVEIAGTKITAANGDEFALSLNKGSLFVNLAQVTATDVLASNGIIHVIDRVLTPPAPTFASGSIVDVAAADGRFNTLVAVLQATQLDSVLADNSEIFTVFAPTDDAFALLGVETIEALLADLPTLTNILLSHVITGSRIDSVTALAATGGSVETASGASVALSIQDGALFVNDSRVTMTDIVTDNGIIHVIDAVIQ